MAARVRKFALTAHIAFSVSWLGAVAAFLALSVAGLAADDPLLARAAYLAMELITWWVIVPLSVASLFSGIIQALGSPWGLLRHHWVLVKLLMTIMATLILLLHTRPISIVATAAAERALSRADLGALRLQLVVDAGAALVALLVTTTLSVYKPRGVTRYGRRKEDPRAAVVP